MTHYKDSRQIEFKFRAITNRVHHAMPHNNVCIQRRHRDAELDLPAIDLTQVQRLFEVIGRCLPYLLSKVDAEINIIWRTALTLFKFNVSSEQLQL